MSYSTGTTHYNLPQTVGTDKRDWTDTNEAFSAVDTALYGAVQDAETATSGIQTLNTAVDTINGKLATDEGNISTLSGKVSTLESTVGTQGAAIADVRQDLQDNIESNHEASATSTHLYNIGDTFYYNDVIYKATAQIAIGETIVPSTNCTAVTVMSEIDQLNSDLTELSNMFSTVEVLGTTTSSSGIDIAVGEHRLFYLSNEYTGTFFSKELLNAKSNKTIFAQFVGTNISINCKADYIDANTIKLSSDGTHSVSLYSLD